MEVFTKLQVCVTGGAGFIGSHLCRTLVEKGAKVTVFDNLSSGKIENVSNLIDKGLIFVQGDIRDSEALDKATKDCDVIIHLAAQASVPFSMENPKEDCEINVVGTLNVLEAAKKAKARLVFASSSAVYGNPEIKPTLETHPVHPISFYGLAKLLGEHYCQFYHKTYGLETVILRIYNVYGPHCHGVLHDYLGKLEKTPNKLEVLGTGNQARDFIYVSDMVNFILEAITSPVAVGQEFNVGTGTTTSVVELARKLVELLSLENVDIYFTGGQAWAGDMDITLADISKAINTLKWRPQVSLEEGLKKVIKSRKHQAK